MKNRMITALALAATILAAGCSEPKISYKGLKLVRPVVGKVVATDVERFLDTIRDQSATPAPLPRDAAVRKGNRVVVDFVGTISGTPFPGGTMRGYQLVLGSDQMIPGFESGIVGMKAGQTKDVKLTFPKDYPESALANKQAVFKVTVMVAQSLTRPPLTDEFASRISGGRITNLADLRKAAKEQLGQNRVQQAEQHLRAQVAEALLVQWTAEPGKRAVNKELERVVRAQIQAMGAQGAGGAVPDVEALKNERRPAVIRSLKLSRILASIAKREKISITEGEVEQSAGQMAQQQGQDPTQFTTYLKENKLWDDMRRRMLEERVMNLILQNAQIEENRRPFAPPAK